MANKVSELKQALGVGARANKYRVNFAFPSGVGSFSGLEKADALCKASSFPSITIGQIEVWNQGRKLIIPGDTSFTNTWTLTFYSTEDHALRRDFINWLKNTDHWQNNSHSGDLNSILAIMSVEQLDSAGNATVKYKFNNVFVQEIGEITVGDDTADTILEFDVTFTFTDWVVGDGETQTPEVANAGTKNAVAE